ncbi:MAG: MBL fold metallo-hydrolase [Candidatus Nomurabacteria bacterium]
MKINFIGLSSFIIENEEGYSVLVDPFNDSPEWILGPNFPKEFNGKEFGANLVLMSHPDADHAHAPGTWLQNAKETKPNSNPFPNLNLRGTVVPEYNGDLNIAWHYTIDGIRLVHFADHSHILTQEQLEEIGNPDIVFISPPKTDAIQAKEVTKKNIELLNPKIIFWAHHVVPKNLPKEDDEVALRKYFIEYFKNNAYTSKYYKGEKSFMELCNILEHAISLNKEYSGITLYEPSVTINKQELDRLKNKPISYLFKSMLANSKVE